jgi:hypothetical protein
MDLVDTRSNNTLEDDYPTWHYQLRGFIDLREREAVEFNQILEVHLSKQVIRWECDEETGWSFELEELVLEIEDIGFEPLKIQVRNLALPRILVDPLRRRLRHILAWPLESRLDMKGFAMILLRLVEEAAGITQDWKMLVAKREGKQDSELKGWNVKDVKWKEVVQNIYENPVGADLDTVDNSGDDILGTSIKDLCEQFPEEYRILHVEPVFRSNLVNRFREQQRIMYEQMCEMSHSELRQCVPREKIESNSPLNTKENLAAELCKPVVTFHGTNRHVVSSIVRHGFIKPGDRIGKKGETLDIRCGASFGIGIYSSPSAEYALWYSRMSEWDGEITRVEDIPGMRIIVCAVLMGRPLLVTRDETRRTENIAQKNAHSHVSPNKLEYVVFNSAQIIPCYVVHLDMGVEEAQRRLKEIPRNPNNFVAKPRKEQKFIEHGLWPAEREAIKQAKKAAAAKWFPYGYGPAKGTSFVIEEIGETSDDEENYGEYQGERVEVDKADEDWQECLTQSSSWFDEYQKSRVTWED